LRWYEHDYIIEITDYLINCNNKGMMGVLYTGVERKLLPYMYELYQVDEWHFIWALE